MPQQPVLEETPIIEEKPLLIGTDFPKQKYADWDLLSYLKGQSQGKAFRPVDGFLFSLFARMAYGDATNALSYVKDALPGIGYRPIRHQSPGDFGWDEWTYNDMVILAFPGTESIGELLTYVGFIMVTSTGENANFLFYNPLLSVTGRYATAISATYGTDFTAGKRRFVFCGHSLGGHLANWLAYKMNLLQVSTNRNLKPVIAAYSFGAPAGWVDTTNQTLFTQYHAHYRTVATNDPVPGLAQAAVVNSPVAVFSGTADQLRVPLHYDSFVNTLGQPRYNLAFSGSLGEDFLTLFNTGIDLANNAAKDHSAASYTALNREYCRVMRDTPIGLFGKLDALDAALTLLRI